MEYGNWKEHYSKTVGEHYFYCLIGNYEGVVFVSEIKGFKAEYFSAIYSNHTGKKLLVKKIDKPENFLSVAMSIMNTLLRDIIIKELLVYNKFFIDKA